ncbi:MAG: glycosyltransferase family 10 domain-containing protein, partial [Anaerolineae bacterium]
MPAKPLIVLDTYIPAFQRNRIFDPDYASRFPGGSAIAKLYRAAVAEGFSMVTSDLYSGMSEPPRAALCISDRVTGFVRRPLRSHQLQGVALLSFESPNVDIRFYHTLSARTALFSDAFLFRGARQRVAPGTQYHEAHFPLPRRTVVYPEVWDRPGFVVMVAGNKRSGRSLSAMLGRGVPTSLRSRLGTLLCYINGVTDEMLRIPDLYRTRLAVAHYFAQRPGFELYGPRWDQPIHGLSEDDALTLRSSWRGAVADKLAAMSAHRFALCFENCVFPGYVTEKVFDCFFAGCIPVYYGAPDITDFVPPAAFIDFRRFGSLSELDRYLRSISDSEVMAY